MTRFGGLWSQADFLKLWGGQSISILGSSITSLALPTTAILVLHATAFEVGLLLALVRLPFPIFALPAGAWIDRVRRKPLMIAANCGQALALATIPLAAAANLLTLYQLYGVALVTGVFTVVFDLAYLAYVPGLVGREAVVEGNTKLQFSSSVSYLVGPGLAGLVIQAIGAARAFALDAASFVISALALVWIRTPEPLLRPSGLGGTRDVADGIAFVFSNPLLRSLVLIVGISLFGFHAAESAQFPFLFQQLHLSPATVGLLFSMAGIGALLGVIATARVVAAVGVGRAIALAGFAEGLAVAGLALAAVLPALPTLAILIVAMSFIDPIHNVTQWSLRQGLTPDALQGRMNATFRTICWGAWPLGNLVGGALATRAGFVPTIVLGGLWGGLVSLAVFVTPLRAVRVHPGTGKT